MDNHRYYVLAEPVISDQFDALLDELGQVQPPIHSPEAGGRGFDRQV